MRYSDRPFPPYSFVPGRSPHPTRDPAGHSHGREEPPLASFGEHNWERTEAFLYGIDLFNHGYWWEAHESWERCWIAAGRRSDIGYFVQGLIQVAVACLKRQQGLETAAQQMACNAIEKLPLRRERCLGVPVVEFRTAVEAYFRSGSAAQPPTIRLGER